jgi:single-strand DNA-binding protein
MSRGLNKVQIIGRLGADPEVKIVNDDLPVATFSVAVDESYKDKNGELVEKVTWVRCNAWRKLADVVAKWTARGKLIYVEGKLNNRSWEKDGQKHYSTDVTVDNVVFLEWADPDRSDGRDSPTALDGVERNADGSPRPDDLPF